MNNVENFIHCFWTFRFSYIGASNFLILILCELIRFPGNCSLLLFFKYQYWFYDSKYDTYWIDALSEHALDTWLLACYFSLIHTKSLSVAIHRKSHLLTSLRATNCPTWRYTSKYQVSETVHALKFNPCPLASFGKRKHA